MASRSRGYRSQRRRRVLLDGSRAEEAYLSSATLRTGKRRRYPADALRGSQPYITDFLPEKATTIGAILAVFALFGGTVLTLAWFKPYFEAKTQAEIVRFLDLGGVGSLLNVWLSAIFVSIGSWSLILFFLRRRRLDDYHGTYQTWLCAAAIFYLTAGAVSVDIYSLLKDLLLRIPALRDSKQQELVYPLALGTLWLAIGLRGVIEMRRCRLAQVFLVLAGLFAAGSQLPLTKLLNLNSYRAANLVSATLLVLGLIAALASVLAYGRFVRLDAQGLVSSKKLKKKLKSKSRRTRSDLDEAEEIEDGFAAEEIDDEIPEGSIRATINGVRAEEALTESADEDETSGGRLSGLSKTERKRLRRQQRRAS